MTKTFNTKTRKWESSTAHKTKKGSSKPKKPKKPSYILCDDGVYLKSWGDSGIFWDHFDLTKLVNAGETISLKELLDRLKKMDNLEDVFCMNDGYGENIEFGVKKKATPVQVEKWEEYLEKVKVWEYEVGLWESANKPKKLTLEEFEKEELARLKAKYETG